MKNFTVPSDVVPPLTPETAPRELKKLMENTPFQLRLLANKLEMFATDEDKEHWHLLKTQEERAGWVLISLLRWDNEHDPLPGKLAGTALVAEVERRMGTA